MAAAAGEVYGLTADTHGAFKKISEIENVAICGMAGGYGTVYVVTQPIVITDGSVLDHPCTTWAFDWVEDEETGEKALLPRCMDNEFSEMSRQKERVKMIAQGYTHTLALADSGKVFSMGESFYGSTGQGGAKSAEMFSEVQALKGTTYKYVACGKHCSLVIANDNSVFCWGENFHGEAGIFSPVEAVPRFSPLLTKRNIRKVSFGDKHAIACTQDKKVVCWGANDCGQLGCGDEKREKNYVPYEIPCLEDIEEVCAGWAHSIAITGSGAIFSWGLNSHGQLGLGDTAAKSTPQVVRQIDATIVQAVAGRACTTFRSDEGRVFFCGRFPRLPEYNAEPAEQTFWSKMELFGPGDLPRRVGQGDPFGCALCPVEMDLPKSDTKVSNLVCSGLTTFAFSSMSVFDVSPSVMPIEGGTKMKLFVRGLPFDHMQKSHEDLPVRVRLKCHSPVFDVVVNAKIVQEDAVEFISQDMALSPMAPFMVEECIEIFAQISVDGGLRFTEDSTAACYKVTKYPDHLWKIVPSAAPIQGNSELFINVHLPKYLPSKDITVAFRCTPRPVDQIRQIQEALGIDDPLPAQADLAETYCDDEEIAETPPCVPLELYVAGRLDAGGKGVRCFSPPFDPATFYMYDVEMDISFDGQKFLNKTKPFQIFDCRVNALLPNCGHVGRDTEVIFVTNGLVSTDVQRVRMGFPHLDSVKEKPGVFNRAAQELSVTMQNWCNEIDKHGAEGNENPQSLVAGKEIPVELSLNGQNYTDDGHCFMYYGDVTVGEVEVSGQEVTEPVNVGQQVAIFCQGLVRSNCAAIRFKTLKAEGVEDPNNPTDEDFEEEVLEINATVNMNDQCFDFDAPSVPTDQQVHLDVSLDRQLWLTVSLEAPITLVADPDAIKEESGESAAA